jgi:hypothetical protein
MEKRLALWHSDKKERLATSDEKPIFYKMDDGSIIRASFTTETEENTTNWRDAKLLGFGTFERIGY